MQKPIAEGTLENPVKRVPKVQGVSPNLSGKRTEQKYICLHGLYFSELLIFGNFFILHFLQ